MYSNQSQKKYYISLSTSNLICILHSLILIPNLNFDSSLCWIRSNVECSNCVFQGKSVGNKWLNIDQATSNETDGLWILEREG